ncbi:hypothetical protein B6N60_01329 [Richelia sinica FACHB-800]|uniref:Uncharacterized protein n=1 Tax=Richelia sinica FACHB-800 TaxID=1357546 RepID=A0A975T5Y1_9NOST|nr:hypothetical protein B6N60_01329 [Richelia sinica FACHB-800]
MAFSQDSCLQLELNFGIIIFLAYSFCGQIPEADILLYPKIAHLKGRTPILPHFGGVWLFCILNYQI